jgi:DNA-directed RNA polymerase specialized sigma24 family protein
MLASYASVERALTHYTDRLQPRTGSVTSPGGGKGSAGRNPFHPALLERLEERTELRRRIAWLAPEEAVVLLRWYVEGAKPDRIARDLGRSLRYVYRRRAAGLDTLVALGCCDDFTDADVSEFI